MTQFSCLNRILNKTQYQLRGTSIFQKRICSNTGMFWFVIIWPSSEVNSLHRRLMVQREWSNSSYSKLKSCDMISVLS